MKYALITLLGLTALLYRPNQEYYITEVCATSASALNSTGEQHSFGSLSASDSDYLPIWDGEIIAMSVVARTAANGEIQIVANVNDAQATDTLFVADSQASAISDSIRIVTGMI